MKYTTRRMLPLALCLMLAVSPVWAAPKAPERKAATVDDELSRAPGRLNVLAAPDGAYLATGADADAAWRNLHEMLARLRIPVHREDAARRELTTDWIRWKVDPKTGRAFSRVDLLRRAVAAPLMEDHRFRLWIDTSAGEPRLHIADAERLAEYKFTDDPDYSWIKWREEPPSPEAARTFLQHVSGVYEAVGATRIVMAPTAQPAPGMAAVASPAAPVSLVAVPAVQARPPVAPPLAAPASPPVAAPTVSPLASPATPAVSSAARRAPPAQSVPVVAQPVPVAQPALTPPPAQPVPRSAGDQTASVRPLTNALQVRATGAQTWRAVREALEGLEMGIAGVDEKQGLIVTGWLDYRYDARKDRFERNPNESEKLFLGFSGPQKQRHIFQLRLAPGSEPDTMLVYAAQQSWEAQDFRTPGGGDDLALIWKPRTPDSEAALAFLRLLSTRLHIAK